ncbi:MAG: PAS domain S-box protein, partial [Salinivirgaceae bacterium]|nr:PAS domain S-box protein [Salinivirgaceae bacterium]
MKKEHKSEAALLRQKAEELMKNKSSKSGKQLPDIETQKLIHELEVHQIELELQNEELIQAQVQATIAAEKYIDLYDFAPSGYFTLSAEGEILELNLSGAKMLGKVRSQLINRMFHLFISYYSKPVFLLFLEKVLSCNTKESCELTMLNDANPSADGQLILHLTGIPSENGANCLITAVDMTERKLAEQAVKEGQEKLNTVFNVMQEGMALNEFVFDEKGEIIDYKILEINRAFEQITSLTREQAVGHNATEIFRLSHEYINSFWKQHSNDTQSIKTELYDEIHKRWTSISTSIPFQNKFTTVFFDISEQKLAEEKLKESEKLFHHLFSASPDAIMLLDPTDPAGRWTIVNCNEIACTMNGYKREELIGKSIDILNITPGTPEERAEYQESLRRKSISRYETFHRHHDGHIFPVEVSTSIISFGDHELILGIDRDITDRKQAEEQLHKSKSELEEYFENDISADYVVSLEGEIFSCNSTFIEMFGFEHKSHAEKFNITDLYKNPDDRKELIRRVKSEGKAENYEVEFMTRKGTVMNVILNAIGIFNDAGKLVQIRGYVVDITDRKQAEEALKESEKNLQEKVTELSLLYNTTSSLLKHDSKDDIYNFLGENIYRLSGADYMFLTGYHEQNETALVRQFFGVKPYVERVSKMIGMNVNKIQIPFKDLIAQMDLFQRSTIYRVEGGLYTLTTQKIPQAICKSIEKLLGIEELLSTGFVWQGNYFGGVTFGFKKGNQLKKRDLIESIINQAALALSRKYYEESLLKLSHAVEQSPVSILITDKGGNIEYSNPKVTQITGYQPAELMGKNPRIFSSGEKPKSEYKLLWDTISSGKEWFGELHNKKKNGELFLEYASLSPI